MSDMSDSILTTTKKMLGLETSYEAFDTDIIVFINSALMTLQQLGVGPVRGFTVSDPTQKWGDFLPSDTMLEGAKTYIYLKVRMLFDPPGTSFVMDAMKQQAEELEWRLREQAELYPGDGSRKGYWEQHDPVDGSEISSGSSGTSDEIYSDGGFRAHGGRYSSDPDFPWKDGPAQPAVTEPDGGS